MPAEGRAILSQIEGLCEQFLALDYDTPVKTDVENILGQVRSGMEQMSSETAEPRVPPSEQPEGEKKPFREYGEASDAAMKDKVLQPKGNEPQADSGDETDPRKRKRF
jgi:hypothetical protein